MTIFGKLLIFVNLLAAGGFVYLATRSWQAHQTIEAAGVKHVLIVHGLPLGTEKGVWRDGKPNPARDANDKMPTGDDAEIPFQIRLAGGFRTDTISKKLLDGYLKAVPGNSKLLPPERDANLNLGATESVPNQLAEVKRVKAKIDAALAAADSAGKLTLLKAWMQYQPDTYADRLAVLDMIAKEDVEGLTKALNFRFTVILDSPQAPDLAFIEEMRGTEDDRKLGLEVKLKKELAALAEQLEKAKADKVGVAEALKAFDEGQSRQKGYVAKVDETRLRPIDDAERRWRIAHLLVHLDQDPEWQKRVAVIVGLRRYAPVIVAQGARFQIMAEGVRLSLPADQAVYFAAERDLLRLAADRTELANKQAELKRKWEDQETNAADFVGKRAAQLNEITARLNAVKANVDELLTQQSGIESALFEVQREVAVTLDEVYRLETLLEARERELLKAAPKN